MIKIGKYYITRNNPRELLKERAELIDLVSDLQKENEKLKKIIKVYENPDDMTSFFENCDEITWER